MTAATGMDAMTHAVEAYPLSRIPIAWPIPGVSTYRPSPRLH